MGRSQTDLITVHHLENSRSQRILWLLEELEIDYAIEKYKRDPVTSLAPPKLLKLHPLGKAPVVTDGDITLAESAAIVACVPQPGRLKRVPIPTGCISQKDR